MKPLILTGCSVPEFDEPEFADLTVNFIFRFGWGPLPSRDELATYLGPGTPDVKRGHHWSDFATGGNRSKNRDREDLDLCLAEFCQQYETVELWFDVQPNAQLQLIWLLDYFRSYPETIGRLKLRLVDLEMSALKKFGRWRCLLYTSDAADE